MTESEKIEAYNKELEKRHEERMKNTEWEYVRRVITVTMCAEFLRPKESTDSQSAQRNADRIVEQLKDKYGMAFEQIVATGVDMVETKETATDFLNYKYHGKGDK